MKKKSISMLACAGVCAAQIGSVSAATVSYWLNQSNAMPDGINYALVTLADISGGGVTFTVTPDLAIFDETTNFGIQTFAFNSDLALTAANYLLPSGWSAAGNIGGGFGSFLDYTGGTGSTRQNPLTFSVNTGTISNYVFANTSGYFFGAHIAGFTNSSCVDPTNNTQCTSAKYAATGDSIVPPTSVVPVPASAWLFATGLIGLVGVARRKARHLS